MCAAAFVYESRTGRAVRLALRPADPGLNRSAACQETDQPKYQENEEENFRNSGSGARDTEETQHPGNQSDNKKNQ